MTGSCREFGDGLFSSAGRSAGAEDGEGGLRCSGPPHIVRGMDTVQRSGLQVNGEWVDVPDGASVAALLALLRLDACKVAVELNEEIVPRSQYAATVLASSDRLEVVHFIGGG